MGSTHRKIFDFCKIAMISQNNLKNRSIHHIQHVTIILTYKMFARI
ncbi:hypothetical protein P689_12229 [Candidatus Riesia pediculischaeffi PTSU]|uniref:Uncharacterized protein n=1 Tax=Candidatus Riesia pediculischaeffi PTSU TaxID=1401651 RepID=A0A0C1VJ57_9ENTR|nr:hypothetical protein P689_12229 [Candidatus Riesia pediculischaeffi PTSU]